MSLPKNRITTGITNRVAATEVLKNAITAFTGFLMKDGSYEDICPYYIEL